MRRNYLRSIVFHICLLLLILLFPFLSQSEEQEEMQHVIVVDFSHNSSTTVMATPKGGASRAKAAAKPKPIPSKVERKKTVASASKAKSYDNDNLQVSQKLNAEKPKVKPVEAQKEVLPPPIPQPSKEEIEAAKKAEELKEKKSQLANLLSKSKKKEVGKSSGTGEDNTQGSGSSKLDASGDHSKGSIRGILGNRKVLRVPTIKDDSQKKGRVVVKICVDASGDVVSSNYTMMGSTTSDTYLIKLAEEGAKGYKFSPSENPKECGKVTIEFLLK